MKFKTAFLFILIFSAKFKSYSQEVNLKTLSKDEQIQLIKIEEENYRESHDSIGVWIQKSQFDSLVAKHAELIDSNIKELNYKDLIIVVRISNTIAFRDMAKIEKYKLFNTFFAQHYFNIAVVKREAFISKGFRFYSKKHDIYIGWSGLPNNNSLYFLPS